MISNETDLTQGNTEAVQVPGATEEQIHEFSDKERKMCYKLFGCEPAFIKQLLTELETRTMQDLIETTQFNIGFNEGLKTSAQQLEKSLTTMFGEDQTKSINEELNAQPMPEEPLTTEVCDTPTKD